jgi:pseudaminic acid synthase
MSKHITIAGRRIGPGEPAYVIAELSGNHNGSIERAMALVDAAHHAGADALKLQTYTADTITLDCRNEYFQIKEGTLWQGKILYDLYREAHTPWEWHLPLKNRAEELGMHCFSSPFDATAVDFLETLDVPAYKIASFELVDLPLIRKVAGTGKPLILSTGMASLAEIDEAVRTARDAGAHDIALLKTNSAYPAPASEMHLSTIRHLSDAFDTPSGLSDHTLGIAVPVAATALGASLIEKHLCMSRAIPGPDSEFSLEPEEFKHMVESIRIAEAAVGHVRYAITPKQQASKQFRRSLFVVTSMKAGDPFTSENVRSIRPANGLHTRHLPEVIGRRAAQDIERGTPLAWSLIG